MSGLNRRHFFTTLTTVTGALFALAISSARTLGQSTFRPPRSSTRLSPTQTRGGGRVATLQESLNAGLKVRRDVEFQFVADVVRLVEQKRLPVKLVTETFHYARKKRQGYPFQYFQRALALRAAKIGVRITPVK